MGNNIVMSSDQQNELAGIARKASHQAGDSGEYANRSFEGMVQIGPGYGEISKQLAMHGDSLNNIQGIIGRQSTQMFDMDTALANVAEAINVPMDFVKNDASRFTQYHNELLEKVDGKSVNEGEDRSINDTLDASAIGEEAKIGDITSETAAREEVYDDSSAIGNEEAMANINKAGGEEQEEYDARSKIAGEETMGSIARAGGEEEQAYNGESQVTEEMLRNINKASGLEAQEYNGNSKANEVPLVNINQGSGETVGNNSIASAQAAVNDLSKATGIGIDGTSAMAGMVGVQNSIKPEPAGMNKSARDNALDALEALQKM